MKNAAYISIVAITVVIALVYGQSLIVPFILGILMWFLMHSLKRLLDKIPFVKQYVPSWVKTLMSSGIIVFLVVVLFQVLSNNIKELTYSYQKYESNVGSVILSINEMFNINVVESVKEQIGDFNFGAMLQMVFNSISYLIGNTFMIIIYALFILLEESNFGIKLKALFTSNEGYNNFVNILGDIDNSIAEYFKLKAIVSLMTGVLSFIVLWLIGVDSPVFWAFLIFILNFIPTIGSLIGTVFPAAFALLQFGDIYHFLLVIGLVGAVQLLVGNIIEPRLMGSTMNISPLVTILALSFWGAIWGVVGMILSVPITVIMILVFSRFEKTRPIAVLLSEKGKVNLKKVESCDA